jgi:hypothetical protein
MKKHLDHDPLPPLFSTEKLYRGGCEPICTDVYLELSVLETNINNYLCRWVTENLRWKSIFAGSWAKKPPVKIFSRKHKMVFKIEKKIF